MGSGVLSSLWTWIQRWTGWRWGATSSSTEWLKPGINYQVQWKMLEIWAISKRHTRNTELNWWLWITLRWRENWSQGGGLKNDWPSRAIGGSSSRTRHINWLASPPDHIRVHIFLIVSAFLSFFLFFILSAFLSFFCFSSWPRSRPHNHVRVPCPFRISRVSVDACLHPWAI